MDVRGDSAMPKSMGETGDADNHHSLPHLDDPSSMIDEKKEKAKKRMQTFAGVAGNVLEWCVVECQSTVCTLVSSCGNS
jgi:hypothetical protein